MITVEIDPALSVPHLTECTQSFLSLPGFNDELLSFQNPNMYELRSALLCLIRCLVYNVTLRSQYQGCEDRGQCVQAQICSLGFFSWNGKMEGNWREFTIG